MSRLHFGGGCPTRLPLAPLARLGAILGAILGTFLIVFLLAPVVAFASRSPSRTLDAVRGGDLLSCGVVVEQEDFTKTDTHGDLSLFGSAICRAIAAAVLGDAHKVSLQGYPDDAHGVAALRDGRIAVLVGTTPETTLGMLEHLRFSPVLFYDGQSFLVRHSLNIRNLADLRGRLICYLSETPADAGMIEWSARTGIAVRPHPFEEGGEMEAALTSGNCDAITGSVSNLAGMRAGFHAQRHEFDILPQMIALEPFAAATRDGDAAWTTIISDVATVLIEAQEIGVTRSDLAAGKVPGGPAALRLFGSTPGLRSLLGLRDGWARRAVSASGNYGEILELTTGKASPLELPPGANALWSAGGLIAAPQFP